MKRLKFMLDSDSGKVYATLNSWAKTYLSLSVAGFN